MRKLLRNSRPKRVIGFEPRVRPLNHSELEPVRDEVFVAVRLP